MDKIMLNLEKEGSIQIVNRTIAVQSDRMAVINEIEEQGHNFRAYICKE